ncbi:MAG: tetratricopeptide repeat protein [Deltaproteobacteria bacterium]|nr:tetratricopeptide repeat protein [Deltaproteobacteria bacterium]
MNINDVIKSVKDIFKKAGPNRDIRELMVRSAENPKDMRLKLEIGKLYFKKKDLRNAIAHYREVAENYIEDEFFLKAIAVYKEILKYSPSSVEFNEKLGDLFTKLEMGSDAAQQYQIALYYYRSHKQTEDALRIAKKLCEAEPDRHAHRVRLAELMMNSGDEEAAIQEFEKLAEKLSGKKDQLKSYAEVLEKLLVKKKQTKEQNHEILQKLCRVYLELNDPDRVLTRLERLKINREAPFDALYQEAKELKSKNQLAKEAQSE